MEIRFENKVAFITGAVNDTEYSRQAYELGCKCFG